MAEDAWFQSVQAQAIRPLPPHDFIELVKLLKPRKIIPVHTMDPRYMLRFFEKTKNM